MRLRTWLVQVAALVAASGCSSAATVGGGDGGEDAIIGCSCCSDAAPPTHDVTGDVACGIAGELTRAGGAACSAVCGPGYLCSLPTAYQQAYDGLNTGGDSGAATDGSADASGDGGPNVVCPTVTAPVTVTCYVNCTGRRTAGFEPQGGRAPRSDGERLAAMAWLEAVSVHAFDRLGRELTAHGAPAALLRDARRARRDEVRHTAMTAGLARRRGARARLPEAPPAPAVRTLFEVARENAVEGCVRETYGAVTGLVEAQTSRDPSLRRAMGSIAADECRHAELAWAVHAWAMARMSPDERASIEGAMKEAIVEIEKSDPRVAGKLFAGLMGTPLS
jgi:hypothetical protein